MFIREVARAALASAVHSLNTVKVGHRITDSRFAAWVCGDGAVIARLRYGAQAVVFANDYVGRSMYLWGEFDPRINAVITAVVREGDTVLDIGANFGVNGLLAARCVGPTGTVHLFEPQPIVASCLRTSLLINGYSNGVVHECALSDRAGQGTMTIEAPWKLGAATPDGVVHECALSDHAGQATMTTEAPWALSATTLESPELDFVNPLHTTRVRTQDAGQYVGSLGCDKVTLIKIDVEGHEPIIFASMREWLAEKRPPVILFECHLHGQVFQRHESVRILSGLGYEFLWIDKKPIWHTNLCVVNENQHPIGYDFVAVLWQELDEDRRGALEAMMA